MGCTSVTNSNKVIKQKLKQAQTSKIASLSEFQLSEIPKQFLKIELRTIDCSHNKIVKLPEDWENLVGLTKLYLNSNSLSRVSLSLNSLTYLQELKLDHNYLQELPSGLSLPNLQLLCISNNRLSFIPDSVVLLLNLREIRASHNEFRELPRTISASKNLESIDFSYNSISVVYDDWRPTKLSLINLDYNPITTLPRSLLINSNVSRLIMENTGVTVEKLRKVEGFSAYEMRHKARVDRAVDMNVEAKIGLFR